MMNLSELITSIKRELGIYGITLPVDNLDGEIYDIIKAETLKTFSQFFPQKHTLELDFNQLDVLREGYSETIIRLPIELFGDRRVISVLDVNKSSMHKNTGYMTPEIIGGMEFYDTMMMGHATAHLNSITTPPFTFKFMPPQTLHLYNYTALTTSLSVTIALEHFENLSSIPNSSWESFRELAVLDAKRSLYGMIKHYNGIQTAHGTIDLKIDDWADAVAQRKEIVENWRRISHLDSHQVFII